MGWIMGIVGFVTSNWQILSIAAGGVTIVVLGLTVFNYISTNAKNEVLIEQYKQNQVVLEKAIDNEKRINAFQKTELDLTDQALQARDQVIGDMQQKLDNIDVQKLGPDVNDQAPQSIKNLIKQMQESGL